MNCGIGVDAAKTGCAVGIEGPCDHRRTRTGTPTGRLRLDEAALSHLKANTMPLRRIEPTEKSPVSQELAESSPREELQIVDNRSTYCRQLRRALPRLFAPQSPDSGYSR